MFSRTFFTLALSSLALAASMLPSDGLVGRDDGVPSDADLLSSCPGSNGSYYLLRADRCTLINIFSVYDVHLFSILGEIQRNCGSATEDIEYTFSGSTEVSQSTTTSVDIGFDFHGVSIGGGIEYQHNTTTITSNSITYKIPPGKQAVYVANVTYTSQTGNIQVNYGNPQWGHYVWYTQGTVTRLTPHPDEVEYDVKESDCDTDPTANLNLTSSTDSKSAFVASGPEVEYGCSGYICGIWIFSSLLKPAFKQSYRTIADTKTQFIDIAYGLAPNSGAFSPFPYPFQKPWQRNLVYFHVIRRENNTIWIHPGAQRS